jgi:FtsH-binding integral membrane protein
MTTAARPFYVYMSLACAVTAFAGFAPTYFLRSLSDLPPLSLRAHIHGALSTAWMLLFVAQTVLVRADRRDLHRSLGIAGAVLAALVVWAGFWASIGAVVRFEATGFRPHGLTPVAFLSTQLGTVLQFAVLVGLGLVFRRRSDVHKRLMLLATISMLPPAIARLHLENYGVNIHYSSPLVAYVLVVIAAAFDLARLRRVHPVYIWGGPAMLAWMVARSEIGTMDWWQPIGRWLVD